MTPILLILRMNLWVTIYLRGTRQQNFGPGSPSQAKDVKCAKSVCFDGFNRVEHVVWRGGRRCQVIYLVRLDIQWLNDIVVQQLKVRMTKPVMDIAPTGANVHCEINSTKK